MDSLGCGTLPQHGPFCCAVATDVVAKSGIASRDMSGRAGELCSGGAGRERPSRAVQRAALPLSPLGTET